MMVCMLHICHMFSTFYCTYDCTRSPTSNQGLPRWPTGSCTAAKDAEVNKSPPIRTMMLIVEQVATHNSAIGTSFRTAHLFPCLSGAFRHCEWADFWQCCLPPVLRLFTDQCIRILVGINHWRMILHEPARVGRGSVGTMEVMIEHS